MTSLTVKSKSSIFLVFLVFSTTIFFASNCIAEIGFGSLQKDKEIKVGVEGSGKAEILVWNSGKESFTLSFFVSRLPEGWKVEIHPNSFLLTGSPEGKVETVVVNGKQFKAKVVEVKFVPLANAQPGKAVITAIAKSEREGQISVSQARDFKFSLIVESKEGVVDTQAEKKKMEENGGVYVSNATPPFNGTLQEKEGKNVTSKTKNEKSSKEIKEGSGLTGFVSLFQKNPNLLTTSLAALAWFFASLYLYLSKKVPKRRRVRRASF